MGRIFSFRTDTLGSFAPLILIMHRFLGQFLVFRLRCTQTHTHTKLQRLGMVTTAASPHPYSVAIVTVPLLALSHLLVLFLLFHPLMRHFVLQGRNVSLYFLGSDAFGETECPRPLWKILHLCFLPLFLVALLESEML